MERTSPINTLDTRTQGWINGFIGVVISLASFVLGRMDARKERNEDSKRTQLLADYLHGVQQKPVRERPSSAEVITESMNRINNDGATD